MNLDDYNHGHRVGRDEERAHVVAWLRTYGFAALKLLPEDASESLLELTMGHARTVEAMADRIEAGAHTPKRDDALRDANPDAAAFGFDDGSERSGDEVCWVSFADDGGFLGVAVVVAADITGAVAECWRLGINPGGEALGFMLAGEAVPAGYRNRLLTAEECVTLNGAGVLV